MRLPLVVGHRGASGHRPEHTPAAYALAARTGADGFEPDLVPTRDGVLVARHESELSGTTDVAGHPALAHRHTTKVVDGVEQAGWFSEDLTLAELRTLRARERLPELRGANTAWDGRFPIPTLQEVLELARTLTVELGRPIAVHAEMKHPARFRSLGLALEEPLAAVLRQSGLAGRGAPVWVQSFEPDGLRRLRALVDVRLVQLLAPGTGVVPTAAAAWADAVGPAKELLSAQWVDEAHRAGLQVHAWTFRAENAFLPPEWRSSPDPAAHGDLRGELAQAFALGVDAVLCDQPEVAVALLGPR